jgi:hypothetical protein
LRERNEDTGGAFIRAGTKDIRAPARHDSQPQQDAQQHAGEVAASLLVVNT